MNDDRYDGLTPEEREIARRLDEAAAIMAEQDRALAELDREAIARIRRRVIPGDERPAPAAGRRLRQRVAGVAAAAAIALGIVIGLLLRPTPPFTTPIPTRADLLFNLPVPASLETPLSPTTSAVHAGHAHPYRGHLALAGAPAPTGTTAPAYLLASPRNIVPLGRRLLGIDARPRRLHANNQVWIVAADRSSRTRDRLHSLAVSLTTGELIYHDRRTFRLSHSREPLPAGRARRVARAWLGGLGWPASSIRVAGIALVPDHPKIRQVVFDWPDVTRAAIDEATLWLAPDGSVIEVTAWPPAAKTTALSLRPVSIAWQIVRQSHLVVVHGTPARASSPGAGRLAKSALVSLLVPRSGRVYLVPGYRFDGRVHLPHGLHTWQAVASAIQ